MAAVILDSPSFPLYRVGRAPDPLAWPPIEFTGGGRFDDPRREYRVLYCAERKSGCFIETLAQFRPSLDVLARLRAMRDGNHGDDAPTSGVVADDWHLKRMIGTLRLVEGQRFLDLRHPQTLEFLRRELPELILAAQTGMPNPDLDMSTVLSTNRRLTQALSRWVHEQGLNGVVYLSRFDVSEACWALLEGVHSNEAGISRILRNDMDLLGAAHRLGLQISAIR
jgi:hypothetical protein